MAIPRQFRFLAKAMTRSPLSDRAAVPFEPKGGAVVSTRPDGQPLRAIVTVATVEIEVGSGSNARVDYVERCTATFSVADLPRMPQRGDWVHVDGKRLSVAVVAARVGLVDCVLVD